MRLLLTGLGLLVLVGLVAEVAAPPLVEARVEDVVHERTEGATTVRADAGRFPFVPGLLLNGVVDHLTITLEEVRGQAVPLSTVAFTLRGIHLRRPALLRGEVEVTGLDAGTVLVEVERRRLARAAGVPVELDPALVELTDRVLRVGVAGGPTVEVPVPEPLLPCTPDVEVTDDHVRLRCRLGEVPDVLVRTTPS